MSSKFTVRLAEIKLRHFQNYFLGNGCHQPCSIRLVADSDRSDDMATMGKVSVNATARFLRLHTTHFSVQLCKHAGSLRSNSTKQIYKKASV